MSYELRSLSWSQMEAFMQCQLKWAFQKVYRKSQRPGDNLIGGRAFHNALQADGEAHRNGWPRLSWMDLVDVFRASLMEELNKDDPTGLLLPAYNWLVESNMARLRAYVDDLQPHYFPNELEQELVLDEVPGLPGVRFTGRFDGRVGDEFVDFKTANKPWEAGAHLQKPQAKAYVFLDLLRPDGLPRATSTTFHVFPVQNVGGDAACYPQLNLRVTPTKQDLANFQGLVVNVGHSIQRAADSGSFRPSTSALCGYCGFLEHCNPGRQYMWQKRRVSNVPGVPTPTDAEAAEAGWTR